jgi:hypothetical protein
MKKPMIALVAIATGFAVVGTVEAYTQQTFQAKDAKGRTVSIQGASSFAECAANARSMGFNQKQINAPGSKCKQLFPSGR